MDFQWLTFNEAEILELSQHIVEEIQEVMELGIL